MKRGDGSRANKPEATRQSRAISDCCTRSRFFRHTKNLACRLAIGKDSDCIQSSESFRPPFSKGGAVEGAEPSSPSADGEILLSALSFCKAFSLRLHGQRKSVVQIRSFLWLTPFVYSLNSCLSLDDRQEFLYSLPDQRKENFRFLTASDDLIRKELFKIFYRPLGDQIFLANKSLAITR